MTVVEGPYLPESTNYGSGRDDAETRAYTKAMEDLITAHGAGLIISTSFDEDPFLLALARKYPEGRVPPGLEIRRSQEPAECRQPKRADQSGPLCERRRRRALHDHEQARLRRRQAVRPGAAQREFVPARRAADQPEAAVQVIFTGEWEDETHDAAATNKLVDAGCDVITCHLDAPAVVIETAEKRGVKTCGHAFDQEPLAPKGYITGAEHVWTGMFESFVETLQKGGTLPNFVIGGYDKGYVASSPFGAGATPAAINAAKTAIQAMKDNDAIFVGPIKDNKGKEVVPAGTSYGPYADELQETNYLIEGVVGSID